MIQTNISYRNKIIIKKKQLLLLNIKCNKFSTFLNNIKLNENIGHFQTCAIFEIHVGIS